MVFIRYCDSPYFKKRRLTGHYYPGSITGVVEPRSEGSSMEESNEYRLGDLQLEIMKVLWTRGPSTVAEVRENLPDGSLAYTTVATMLRKMENRRLVRHRHQDRRFIYQAAVTEDEVTRSMAHDLVDRLFEGSLAGAMSHLLTTRQVSRDELAELEQLIEQRKRQP